MDQFDLVIKIKLVKRFFPLRGIATFRFSSKALSRYNRIQAVKYQVFSCLFAKNFGISTNQHWQKSSKPSKALIACFYKFLRWKNRFENYLALFRRDAFCLPENCNHHVRLTVIVRNERSYGSFYETYISCDDTIEAKEIFGHKQSHATSFNHSRNFFLKHTNC